MRDLFLLGFVLAIFTAGLRRPFILVLAYVYVDIVLPQKISWGPLSHLPLSLIAFVLAFAGWFFSDDKRGASFSGRQALLVALLIYCGVTTTTADFPVNAADKWSWVWKTLVFAIFLPMPLRTRLRIEALVLTMVLSLAVLTIGGGIKTLFSGGGGYAELKLLIADNFGLYEGSTLSMAALAVIPLIGWLARHGTVFPPSARVTLFALALGFSCLLIPIGTATRTGLLCIGLLAVLTLRSIRHRFAYLAAMAAAVAIALPLLPAKYTERMGTIQHHQADQSAETRIAVWRWTIDYAKDHPFGGGFEAFRGNHIHIAMQSTQGSGNTQQVAVVNAEDKARAYHSSYFEMLGEQGYPGLLLWLALQLSGVWQMERVRARWKRRTAPDERWIAPLANALQQAQLIYLTGSLFVGIAYQSFAFTLIGLQIGLVAYLRRIESQTRAAGMAAARRTPRPIGPGAA